MEPSFFYPPSRRSQLFWWIVILGAVFLLAIAIIFFLKVKQPQQLPQVREKKEHIKSPEEVLKDLTAHTDTSPSTSPEIIKHATAPQTKKVQPISQTIIQSLSASSKQEDKQGQ